MHSIDVLLQKSNNEQINEYLDVLQDSIEDLNKAINIKRKTSSNNLSKVQCFWQESSPINTTFEVKISLFSSIESVFFVSVNQIRQLYETLRFDHPKDGLWPQDGNIPYNTSQWTSTNKLKIILMPHSHCDPGK